MTNVIFEGDGIPPEKLPQPVGWRILVGMLKVEEQSAGGIILTEETRKGKEYLRSVAKVLVVGSESYRHDKFQGGISIMERTPSPWVKVGDIVSIGQYVGQTLSVTDKDGESRTLKLLNDDEVLAVIPDISVLDI